jgi:hypothetical protein
VTSVERQVAPGDLGTTALPQASGRRTRRRVVGA